MMREIETWLSDSRVGNNSVADVRYQTTQTFAHDSYQVYDYNRMLIILLRSRMNVAVAAS